MPDYTGLSSSSNFRLLFEQFSAKAREMHHWTGEITHYDIKGD